jgi:hypothetical protein
MQEKIQIVVDHVNALQVNNTVYAYKAYYGGKWCKICSYRKEDNTMRACSVYCFIALEDINTKVLGQVRRGDVMKAASFAQPAKHARGNVFNTDNGTNCCGPYGVAYLK